MELRHLRYFVRVAEEENISRAALKLHVSQPALSRQIRDLEDELGFPVLERSAKSVRLTDAGRTFLAEARAVLQRVADGVAAARAVAAGGRGEIHVGYAPSLTARLLPPTLRAFQAALPRLRVRLHDLSTEEMLAGLRDGKLELALVVRPTRAMLRGLRFEPLIRDPWRVAVANLHPLAHRRAISLKEVADQSLVAYSRQEYPEYHEMLSAVFARTKARLRIAEEHDSVSSLIAAVEAGVGAALVPESISCLSGSRLKLLALEPEPAPLVVGAALPQSRRSASTETFLKSAREAAETISLSRVSKAS